MARRVPGPAVQCPPLEPTTAPAARGRSGIMAPGVRAPVLGVAGARPVFSFPTSGWERRSAKLRFAAFCRPRVSPIRREAELPDRRPQAELGNEGRTPPAELPKTIRAPGPR